MTPSPRRRQSGSFGLAGIAAMTLLGITFLAVALVAAFLLGTGILRDLYRSGDRPSERGSSSA